MNQQSSNRKISSKDWVPQATLRLPISVLSSECGLHFEDGCDDLDVYQGTDVLTANGLQFILRRYRGEPSDEVGVYLPFEVSDGNEIARSVDAIVKHLRLSPDVLKWRRVSVRPAPATATTSAERQSGRIKIQDTHVLSIDALIAPKTLKDQLPVDEAIVATVVEARETIRRIIKGADRRMLCIVGPCSIHDPDCALDFAERLRKLKDAVAKQLYVVMRVYFEKPRTTVGWKGLINDPRMDDSCDITEGLTIARSLLIDINRMGIGAATEMLDPITPQYIADLIAWSAIGARTTESQTHREMASGLSMPVGFKNSTEGNLQVAINAIQSARQPHSFLGITQDGLNGIVRTTGNPDTHIVLRGGKKPNFDAASIAESVQLLAKAGLEPRVMVDCSHAQTNKDYTKQPEVFAALIEQVRGGSDAILGAMLESNIEAGNQPLTENREALKYGVSITDPCIDWATTERCLTDAAAALASR